MGTLIVLIAIGIGIGIGFWLIKRGAGKAQASGYTRDRAEIADTTEARAAIERWAQVHGYARAGDGTSLLRYQKHVGASSGQPTFLDVVPGNGMLALESYVGMLNPLTRKPQPGEVPLGAPGMILAMPRKAAKREHNALRTELGLPIID
jgi:hypothetical protein